MQLSALTSALLLESQRFRLRKWKMEAVTGRSAEGYQGEGIMHLKHLVQPLSQNKPH